MYWLWCLEYWFGVLNDDYDITMRWVSQYDVFVLYCIFCYITEINFIMCGTICDTDWVMHIKFKFDIMNIDYNITICVSMGCDSTDIDFINCTVINDFYIIKLYVS